MQELPNAWIAPGTTRKHRLPPPRLYRPILVLLTQIAMLVLTIAYIIYTSTGYRQVSDSLASFIINNPASATAGFTLVGSFLSLINSKFSNEAIRFALNVSLGDTKRRGTRLSTFYAATKVVQRSPILKFDGRLNWTIITFFNIFLFTVQTSAWTTLFTPRQVAMESEVKFEDGNFSEPIYAGSTLILDTSKNQIETLISGYDAARQSLGLPASFAHNGFEFNGSTWGILPLPSVYASSYSEWTSIEAVQQGSTANVTCSPIARGDPAIQAARQTSTISGSSVIQTHLCCNCTSGDTSGQGYDYLFYGFPDAGHPRQTTLYIVFTVCPYIGNTNEQGITVYTADLSGAFSKICTIKPQLLDVTVTYGATSADSGTVAIEPHLQLSNYNLNTAIVANFVNDLKSSFFFAQSATGNEIISALDETAQEFNSTLSSIPSEYARLMNRLMANFIRGIYEFSTTGAREGLQQNYTSLLDNRTVFYERISTKSLEVVVWGHIPNIRTPVMLAPLIIMALNIILLIHSFIRCAEMVNEGRWDDLKHIMYFDPMDFLHVLAACKSSNVGGLAFPSYDQDIGKYVEKVDVVLQ
ncbi:hypothetical protein AX15_006172 [Amanita polypyramis BW_CC]|nr:hypothetical protein AX15_006172 [Amanita polypyramis BW_CC]